jgi:hypothetical protein
MDTLQCSSCKEYKDLKGFHSSSNNRGYDYRCKDCKESKRKQRLLDDPENIRERLKLNTRRWRLANEYGISEVEWFAIFTQQDGQCAICFKQFDHPEQMRVDHNHATGAIRELLCNNCNAGIGMLAEDTDRLLSAVQYLIKHSIH